MHYPFRSSFGFIFQYHLCRYVIYMCNLFYYVVHYVMFVITMIGFVDGEVTTFQTKFLFRFRFMVFSATFNNISIISWRSVLLVVETGVLGDNHRSAVCHSQTSSHNVVSSTLRLNKIRNHNRTDCIGSYKSNYHMITTTTAPYLFSDINYVS